MFECPCSWRKQRVERSLLHGDGMSIWVDPRIGPLKDTSVLVKEWWEKDGK